MTLLFFAPYCLGTMAGSMFGVKISMWIEGKLGAAAGGHLNKVAGPTTKEIAAYLFYTSTPIRVQDRHLNFQEWLDNKPDAAGKSSKEQKTKGDYI